VHGGSRSPRVTCDEASRRRACTESICLNGNKRIAITTLLVFLHKNNKWLTADMRDIVGKTVAWAQRRRYTGDERSVMVRRRRIDGCVWVRHLMGSGKVQA